MAEPIGGLRVDVEANEAQFRKDMGKIRSETSRTATKMSKDLGSIRKSSTTVAAGIISIGTALAGLGVGMATINIIKVAAEFQQLEASLKTVTGSTEAADHAFRQIADFAQRTPFDLQQVTESFIKLKALGLDPSMAALESYGNTASAMGKSLNQVIEAVADAATGEFERLKEFGIKARSEGDNVTFTFRKMSTTIGKNAAEIEQYIRNIGDNDFANAMTEQANTLNGAISNLGDAFKRLQNEVAKGGLDKFADRFLRKTTQLLEYLGMASEGFQEFAEWSPSRLVYQLNIVNEAMADQLSIVQDIERQIGAGTNSRSDDTLLRYLDVAKRKYQELRAEAGMLQARYDLINADDVDIAPEPEKIDPSIAKIEELRSTLQFELDQLGRTELGQKLYTLAKSKGVEVNEEFAATLSPLIIKLQEETKAAEEAKKAEEDAADTRDRLASKGESLTVSLRTAQEEYNASMAEYKVLADAGAISTGTYHRAIEEAKKKLDENNESLQKARALGREAGESVTGGFEDAIVKGGELSDVLQGIADDLLRLLVRTTVSQPLNNIFADAFGAAFGGSVGGAGQPIPVSGPGVMATGGSFTVGGDIGRDKTPVSFMASRGEKVTVETPGQQGWPDGGMTVTGDSDVTVNVYAPPGSNVEQSESTGPGGRTIDIMIDEATAKNIGTPGSRTARAMQSRFAGLKPQLAGR